MESESIIMVNITKKNNTLRKAIATAVVTVSSQETIDAIHQGKVPKGNVFEFSRAAGLLAIKKTSDVIPDCHPIPIEYASIKHAVDGLNIIIEVEVQTIYKTGVEVEAMHGATITALTIYDMLKPIDKAIEISSVKLLKKEGGKSDAANEINDHLSFAVVVCSDSISKGDNADSAGKAIVERLKQYGLENVSFDITPDDENIIRSKVESLTAKNVDLIIFTGGTGLSPRDVTPEAISPLIETPIPGLVP